MKTQMRPSILIVSVILGTLFWTTVSSSRRGSFWNRTSPNKGKAPITTRNLTEILSDSEKWVALERKIKDQVDGVLRQVLPQILRGSSEANISVDCQGAIVATTFAIRQLKGWAIKLLDASGKPPGGILTGTLAALGSYDECLSTVAYLDDLETEVRFRGQYCTLLLRPPLYEGKTPRNYDQALHQVAKAVKKGEFFGASTNQYGFLGKDNAVRFGICAPSVCSGLDVQTIAKLVVKDFDLIADVPRCEIQKDIQLNNSQTMVIVILGCLFTMVIFGTCVEIFSRSPKSSCSTRIRKIFIAFSLQSNIRKFLNTTSPKTSIDCLHGLRYVSMVWIIYGHTYFYSRNSQIYRSLINGYDDILNNVFFTPIINLTFGVETFFFISGLLVVYSSWQKLEQNNGSINYIVYILRRFIRLTPALGITLCLIIILPILGSGPLWQETVIKEADNCQQGWWLNVLYLNNFIHYKKMCMPATWYLASNMQLYLVSILFIVPLYKYTRLGVILVSIIGVSGMAVTGFITYVNDLAPAMMFLPNSELLDKVVVQIYHKPYSHAGGFCIGALIGFLLKKKQPIQMHPVVQGLGWLLSITLNVTLLYGIYEWNKGALPNVGVSALYAATHRTAWALPVAWVVYMCATNRAGFINTFLSWKGFIPLSNLSYLAYLIHPLVIIYNLGSRKERLYFDRYNMTYLFFGHFMITIMISAICYLFVELPFANLDKMLFYKRDVEKPAKISEQDSNNTSVNLDIIERNSKTKKAVAKLPIPRYGFIERL